jgi:hypothetical protein
MLKMDSTDHVYLARYGPHNGLAETEKSNVTELLIVKLLRTAE